MRKQWVAGSGLEFEASGGVNPLMSLQSLAFEFSQE